MLYLGLPARLTIAAAVCAATFLVALWAIAN